MATDLWLPSGYKLPNESKVGRLLHSGTDWQIFDTNGQHRILLAMPELVANWDKAGFLGSSLFQEISFAENAYGLFYSKKSYALTPVDQGKPGNKVDALAFAHALVESRKNSANASFHDAIYIEQLSCLLPVWTLTPSVDDDVVLGTWITGGVSVSGSAFRRIHQLTGWWLPVEDLADIVRTAGLSVPPDASLLNKRNPEAISKDLDKRNTKSPSNQARSETDGAGTASFALPGRPELEAFFNEFIVDIVFKAEQYRALGIDFPSATVLHGPPGCGKTYAVQKLVEFIDWPSYSVDSNSVGSPYIHDTAKKISQVFDEAIDNAPSVVIIDEMESFLTDRQTSSASGQHRVEEVAEFLRRIPEAINSRVLIIAMTNMIDVIDPAILRRGRFDHILEVGMPSKEEVLSLLRSLLCKLPIADDVDLTEASNRLAGKALSDSAFTIREAARIAAKAGKKQLDQNSLDAALNSVPEPKENKDRPIGFVWGDK